MRIGIPTEVKNHEYRVAATPEGVRELTHAGHAVIVQAGAGLGSAIHDEQYVAAGASIAPDADAVFGGADLIVKVKEPLPSLSVTFKSAIARPSVPISRAQPVSPLRTAWPSLTLSVMGSTARRASICSARTGSSGPPFGGVPG